MSLYNQSSTSSNNSSSNSNNHNSGQSHSMTALSTSQSSSALSALHSSSLVTYQLTALVSLLSSITGMKSLLLDAATASQLSLIYSHTQLLVEHSVYHITTLDALVQEQQRKISSISNINSSSSTSSSHMITTSDNTPLHYLKCCVLIQPTAANFQLLSTLIQSDVYTSYYVMFTAVVADAQLQRLAITDALHGRSLIASVHECFINYYCCNSDCYHLSLWGATQLSLKHSDQWTAAAAEQQNYEQHMEALLSLLLCITISTTNASAAAAATAASSKRKAKYHKPPPPHIRFTSGSDICRTAAVDINRRCQQQHEFFAQPQEPDQFNGSYYASNTTAGLNNSNSNGSSNNSSSSNNNNGSNSPPLLLLIVDRADDPVTPLLHQWTYSAMIHDLIGINNNTCSVPNRDSSSSSAQAAVKTSLAAAATTTVTDLPPTVVVLNSNVSTAATADDSFYADSMYLNYGDLGGAVKAMVSAYSNATSSRAMAMETVEDIATVVQQLPQLKKQSNNMQKHVAIMLELNRCVTTQQLMLLSEIEQDCVCINDSQLVYDRIQSALQDHNISHSNKLRLVLLYALRYELSHAAELAVLKRQLHEASVTLLDVHACAAVDVMLSFGGATKRSNTSLFGVTLPKNTGLMARAQQMLATSAAAVSGVNNIYTRHKPYIHDLLTAIAKQQLKLSDYPYVDNSHQQQQPVFSGINNQGATPNTAAAAGTSSSASPLSPVYRTVLLFMIGGITHEEIAYVHQFNALHHQQQLRVILGGSCVHNSETYINDLMAKYCKSSSSNSNINDSSSNGHRL